VGRRGGGKRRGGGEEAKERGLRGGGWGEVGRRLRKGVEEVGER